VVQASGELYERRPAHPAGGRHPGPAPGCLDKGGLFRRHQRRRLEIGERHGLEHGSPAPEPQGRRTDQALAGPAVVDNAATLDFDPRLEVVGETEPVALTQLFQVLDDVGGGLVVVSDAALERELGSAGDRLGRYP